MASGANVTHPKSHVQDSDTSSCDAVVTQVIPAITPTKEAQRTSMIIAHACAALLTALRDVARAGGVTAAQSRRVAFATCLTVHPALPDFLRQTPASALAALRACARSNGAPPCGVPPSTAVKRRRCCGGSVHACVQVSALARAAPRRARRAHSTLAPFRCAAALVDVVAAPSRAAGAPVGVASPPTGNAVAPGCAVGAPVGAEVAPEGAVGVPVGTVVAPMGAGVAPAGAVVDRVAAPLRAVAGSVSEGRRLVAMDGLAMCADVGGVVVFRLWVWAEVLRLCLTLRLGLVVVGRWHRWVVLVLYVSVTCLRTAGVARVGVAFG